MWLVACALAMRLIIVPGMMPVIGDGSITISMCTGTGAADVRLPGKPDMPMRGDKGCAFAALAMAAPPEAQLAVTAPTALDPVAPALPPLAARPHLGATAPPPPAIGPPALV